MIKILKYIAYLYLVLAAMFIYDAIVRIQEGREPYISFLFAGAAVFLFFFRTRHRKKIAERNGNRPF